MKKIVDLTGHTDIKYVYRISSVSIDKVTLEKHIVDLNNRNLEGGQVVNYEITEETKVGTVTQKVLSSLIPVVTKMVDAAVIDFKIEDKSGISAILFEGHKNWIDTCIRIKEPIVVSSTVRVE